MTDWGTHPIDPRPPDADSPHMRVLDLRYIPRAGDAAGRRFAREGMDDRKANMEQLRDRIESGTYDVDPKLLAAAVLAANPALRASLSIPARGRQRADAG